MPIPIKREKGTFVLEMIVPKKEQEKEEYLKPVRNGKKQKSAPMEVDNVQGRNYWEAFWSEESKIFQRPE